MKLLLAVVAALAVASLGSSEDQSKFEDWKNKFSRSYSSASEEQDRLKIWLKNWKMVSEHNAMSVENNCSYRLGMTRFADLEHEEFKQTVFGVCLGSFNASQPRHGSAFMKMRKFQDMPNTMDWREEGYVTPVKDQGNCGSCWSFSSTGAMEGQHFRKTGTLVSLSEQQLVDCSSSYGNHGCNGGWMDSAFSYIKDNGGLNSEGTYPYEAKDAECRYDPAHIAARCTGFVDIEQGSEEDLKEAVATVGPVSVAIDVSQSSFQFYESGVYDEPACSSIYLGHAVLVVGYGTEDGQDYWLVKNSWGTDWGDEGYIKMSRNKGNQCGIATAASYPLV